MVRRFHTKLVINQVFPDLFHVNVVGYHPILNKSVDAVVSL